MRLLLAAALLSALGLSAPAVAGTDYKVDEGHSSVVFSIQHLGAAYVFGRFNEMSGEMSFSDDGALESVTFTIEADSVDTNSEKRDKHLRNADFFDVEQFPEITFTSTSIERRDADTFAVTGDVTMHGVTKSMTVDVDHTGEGPDPWGGYRLGVQSEFTLQRSDFGITHMSDGLGDAIRVILAVEGKKKIL